MSQMSQTVDSSHKLPPDKFFDLCERVFAKWNSAFKIIDVSRATNNVDYQVVIELKSGARKSVVI